MTSAQMGLTSEESDAHQETGQQPVPESEQEYGHTYEQESMFDAATDYPGHDLEQLSEETEAFASETRDEYAEPSLTQETEEQEQEPQGNLETGLKSELESGEASGQYPNADAEPAPEAAQQPLTDLPLTLDDFSALEERVLRAVGLVRRERQARVAADERSDALENKSRELEAKVEELSGQVAELQTEGSIVKQLQQEVDSLRVEREQVRQRVERLLGQLDALEL